MIGYKILTHDNRPPLRGGDPLIAPGQSLPHALTPVAFDTSEEECGPGYHFCHAPEEAIRIAGLWPDGRPSRLYRVSATDAIERGGKLRAATLTIEHEFTGAEWRDALTSFSAPFAPFVAEMVESQMLWREALSRPHRDEQAVETGLRAALDARGLSKWALKRFHSTRAAWGAWGARGARAWEFAALSEWTPGDPQKLTTGIRDAYRNGLGIVIPTGPEELGWTMEAE